MSEALTYVLQPYILLAFPLPLQNAANERILSELQTCSFSSILSVHFCQDAEGRAPVHAAISSQHNVIIQLLISHPDIRLNIRDRQGMTPFACAMTHKNNKAAEAILKREPGAAEQVALM